jgi:hypothetical protein
VYLKQYFEENAEIILKNSENNPKFTDKKREHKSKQHSNPQLPPKILPTANVNPAITVHPTLDPKVPQAPEPPPLQHPPTNPQPYLLPP